MTACHQQPVTDQKTIEKTMLIQKLLFQREVPSSNECYLCGLQIP